MNIADEIIAIPIGEEINSFHGVISLSEATAFLVKQIALGHIDSINDCIRILIDEYEVEEMVAERDVREVINKLLEYKLICNS